MRANVRILEFMVNYWDHDLGMFNLQGETLNLTMEIFNYQVVTMGGTDELGGHW